MIPSRTTAWACPCFSTSSLAGLHSSVRSKQLIGNRISFFPILNHFIWPQSLIWTMYFGAVAPLWFGKCFYWVLCVCVRCSASRPGSNGFSWREKHQLGEETGKPKVAAALWICWLSTCTKSFSECCVVQAVMMDVIFFFFSLEMACPCLGTLCFSLHTTSQS